MIATKLHQQFDLNQRRLKPENFNDIPRALNEIPALVEKLIKDLLNKGYIVMEEGVNSLGIPRRITVVKEFTGPFVTHFSNKTREDFKSTSRSLGIEQLFE